MADEVDGLFVSTDVTDAEQVAALYAQAVTSYGGVDIVCRNARISPPDGDSILTTEIDAWRRVQEVNLTSVHLCCRAVLSMARELGVQFVREGVRVNALCPGPVNTPLLQELFAKDQERAARWLVHIPMGRFAEPSEIAAAGAFLASGDSSFITGSTFLVDGRISAAHVTPL